MYSGKIAVPPGGGGIRKLNLFVRCDDPSSHFSTVAMKIEDRLSTLPNKIKENLSLLGDGCSLLTLVNNENYY
jgi:hypothetical protein